MKEEKEKEEEEEEEEEMEEKEDFTQGTMAKGDLLTTEHCTVTMSTHALNSTQS